MASLLAPLAGRAQTTGFTGVFDSSLWSFISGGTVADGSISGTTLTLLGSLNADDVVTRTLYSIELAGSYRISFDWSFTGYDPYGPSWDPVGFTRAGDDYQLSGSVGSGQSGSVTHAYFGGGLFSFYSESDNWSGENDGQSLLTITNFSFTLADPDDDGTDDYGGSGGGGGGGTPPADTVVWTGMLDGNWTQSGNWDPAAPDSTADVEITNGGAVILTGAGTAHSVYLANNSTLTINAGGALTLGDTYSNFAADYGASFTVTGEGSSFTNEGVFTLYTASFLVDDHATASTGNTGFSTIYEDNVSSATVSNGAHWTASTLTIGGGGTATVNVESGGTLDVTGNLYVSNGSLNITSGGTVTAAYGNIGDANSTGSASVTVDGTGSAWTIDGGLSVGSTGIGSLTISDGAVVTDNNSNIGYFDGGQGAVTVTGEGSVWFTKGMRLGIGGDTEGHLTIENGGVVHNAGSYIGMANSVGAVTSLTVTGEGSLLTGGLPTDVEPKTTGLQVGNFGTATLLVSDGGRINGSGGSIGSAFGGNGTVTVTGAGSAWTMTSSFSMDSTSSLTIADGATFTTGGSIIGNSAGSVSTITIGGAGSSWADSSTVVVGYDGGGTLNINAGAAVSIASWLRLGQNNGSHGTIIQTGGTLDIGSYFQFNKGTPVYRLEGGTLKVGDTSFAGIQTGTGSYTFELAGGTIEAKGSTLTIQPNATLRNGTTTTLHTPGSAGQIMYFEGALGGAGSLLKTGAGALYLDAASNTFSGGLMLQQGIVNPYYAGSLGTGALTFAGDSTLQVDARNMSVANAMVINDGITATLDVAGSRTLSYDGAITGTGALKKTSGGALTLSGANTYAGPTTIAGGTLVFAKAASFYNGDSVQWTAANLIVESGATAAFRVGGAGEFTAADVDNFRALGSATGGFKNGATLGLDTTNAAGGFTYAGDIGDTNGGAHSLGVAKLGAGLLTLSGANTYSGGTTITAGTLIAGHAGALGTGAIRLNGGTLQSGGAPLTLANAINLTASGSTLGGAADLVFTGSLANTVAGNVTLTITNTGTTTFGNVSLSPSGNRTLTLNASGGDVAITGTIANGAGTSGLTKSGSGLLTLSGANTYTGATTVSAGTLRATTSAAALGNGSLTVSGTGALELANDTGLAFNRNTTVSSSASFTSDVLTGGAAGVTHTLGTLSIGGQTLTLKKGARVDGGTAGLAFGAVTVTGNTTFSADAGTRLSLASITRNSGTRNLTFTGGGAIASGAITTAGGSLTKTGTGTLTLSGANTYTGATTVNAGTLRLDGSLGNTAVTIGSGATLALGGGAAVAGSTTIAAGGFLTGTGTVGALTLAGTLSPGNSPGTLHAGNTTWTGGSVYHWEIASLDDPAGTGWDLLAVTGNLSLAATPEAPLTLALHSLTSGNDAGLLAGFDATQDYSFVIATTTGSVLGFDAGLFTIDDTGFLNDLDGGAWSVALAGGTLALNFTAGAIPEPSACALFASLAALALAASRRRKSSR